MTRRLDIGVANNQRKRHKIGGASVAVALTWPGVEKRKPWAVMMALPDGNVRRRFDCRARARRGRAAG